MRLQRLACSLETARVQLLVIPKKVSSNDLLLYLLSLYCHYAKSGVVVSLMVTKIRSHIFAEKKVAISSWF